MSGRVNNLKLLATVRTSASSGNLGPGYDIAGLALDIYNEHLVYESETGDYFIKIKSRRRSNLPTDSSNLIVETIKKVLKKFSFKINKDKKLFEIEKPLKIICKIGIPIQRGLGSSSSAIVAGLLIANKVYNLDLTEQDLFNIGLEIEGHPDGIAASLAGGLVICYRNKSFGFKKINLNQNYKILLMIPDLKVSTREARKLIPSKIPVEDCVYNITNFCLLVNSLKEGNLEKAIIFMGDRLHQNYRRKMYPLSMELIDDLNGKWGIPATISGAGPTVIGIMDDIISEKYRSLKGDIIGNYPDFKPVITSINNKGSYYL